MSVAMRPISVMCADDNQDVLEALAIRLRQEPDLTLLASLPATDELLARVKQLKPDIVILDLDMPGLSPFDVIVAVAKEVSTTRVVVFTGHMTPTTVDRAIESGAWGYVSKTDGENALVEAIRSVSLGQFVLSPEVRLAMGYSG